MAIFDHYADEARTIQRKYQAAKNARLTTGAASIKSGLMTQKALGMELEKMQADYRAEVAALQTKADAALQSRATTLRETLQRERAQRSEARRKLLGNDLVAADIMRRQVEAAEPAEIAEMYTTAADQWEREVIAGYGTPLLTKQFRTAPSGDILTALDTLAQVEPEPLRKASAELQDIEQAARRLDELDVEAHNNSLADIYGVRADLISVEAE